MSTEPSDDVLTEPVARRIEVFTGTGRRRKRSAEAKAQIVAESYASSVGEVAALARWAGLCVFLDDGRIEIDSNTVEWAIRPLALNRKNALFAGSDGAPSTAPSSLP